MKVINLYGGPGSGKSTTAAGLFSLMKIEGQRVELVTEFARDEINSGNAHRLQNQDWIFAHQHHRIDFSYSGQTYLDEYGMHFYFAH